MKIHEFASARDVGQQHYHRVYKHPPDCPVFATLDLTGGGCMPIMVDGITTEQPRAGEAESIHTRRLHIVREIHGSKVRHVAY